MPKLPPMTRDELFALPVSVGYGTVCRALGFSVSHGYKLLAAGVFPVPELRYSVPGGASDRGRGAERHYALADLLRHLGYDPAAVLPSASADHADAGMIAPSSVPSPSPEGGRGEEAA